MTNISSCAQTWQLDPAAVALSDLWDQAIGDSVLRCHQHKSINSMGDLQDPKMEVLYHIFVQA